MLIDNIISISVVSILGLAYMISMLRFIVKFSVEDRIDIKEIVEYGVDSKKLTKTLEDGKLTIVMKQRKIKSIMYHKDVATGELKGIIVTESKKPVTMSIKFPIPVGDQVLDRNFPIPIEQQIRSVEFWDKAIEETLDYYQKKEIEI